MPSLTRKQLGCTHLVDAATLTGAIVVALGHLCRASSPTTMRMRERVMAAAQSRGRTHVAHAARRRIPGLAEDAFMRISPTSAGAGAALTAAMFLKEFVGDTPWVHLDIAGTAWLDDAKPWLAKGPTAVPLGSFVQLAVNWK